MPDGQTTPLLTEATFEKLLNRGHYGLINGQLLFHSEELGGYVLTQIRENENYTAQDYMQLPESAPFELLNGKLVYVPSRSAVHQGISMNLTLEIGNYVQKQRLGEFYFAPLDVHFDEENIVQPDLLFVSISRKQIIDKWVKGAPDFVVEIHSEGTAKRDSEEKKALYGKYEVVEYWIVKPTAEEVEVYHNHNRSMQLHQTAQVGDTIISKAIEGFSLDTSRIF